MSLHAAYLKGRPTTWSSLSAVQPEEGQQNVSSAEALDMLKAILEIRRAPARSTPHPNISLLGDEAQVSPKARLQQ